MSTIQQILKDCRASMDKGIDAAKREFASVRSGKATPNMLDTVRVEMYGQQMPLNQVASIAAPEPRKGRSARFAWPRHGESDRRLPRGRRH